MEKQHKGRIEKWTRIVGPRGVEKVIGIIYGHPNSYFKDGSVILTSLVVRIEGDQLETENSLYTLGKPAEPDDA